MSDCYVYLMFIDAGRDDKDFVKVGISSAPDARLRNFQTSSPFKIKMPWTFKLPSRDDAAWVERTFHREQARSRVNGEWFEMYPVGAALEIDLLVGRCWTERRGGATAWLENWLRQAGLSDQSCEFVANELEAA